MEPVTRNPNYEEGSSHNYETIPTMARPTGARRTNNGTQDYAPAITGQQTYEGLAGQRLSTAGDSNA